MSNFTEPVKVGFGRLLQEFHAQLIADTPAMREFAARDFAKCCVWAPGRMIDQAEEMLNSYRKNDNSGAPRAVTPLPIMLVAMTKDYVPAPPEFGPITATPVDVIIPSDPKQRLFQMRRVTAEIRTQVVIVAPEENTARSIAMQLHLFLAEFARRSFSAHYPLAGIMEAWPVQMETPDIMAVAVPTDVKNLTLLAADLSLYASVPMLSAPKSTEPNDGRGEGANQNDPWAAGYDPSGYLVVTAASGYDLPQRAADSGMPDWLVDALADEDDDISDVVEGMTIQDLDES